MVDRPWQAQQEGWRSKGKLQALMDFSHSSDSSPTELSPPPPPSNSGARPSVRTQPTTFWHIKIDQFFLEPDSDDWHSYHETKPSLWVINAVDVATENKIHCHLQQILDIKLFHYQGFSVLLSELFYSIWSVPGKFCSNKRDVRLSMVRIWGRQCTSVQGTSSDISQNAKYD